MQKLFFITAFFLFMNFILQAQQMTRFAVVDTSRIYTAYYRDSTAVRNYEKRKQEFQTEVDRLTSELKSLQAHKLELQSLGDSYGAVKVQTDITTKTAYLTEYTKSKNAELEAIKSRLTSSDDFYKSLYEVIGRVAEFEGYSMVMSLQQASSILWYSSSVDITDKVISSLNSR
ncbi:MAG: OmpH family outer membrane protein [Treponemataceae bacterium]